MTAEAENNVEFENKQNMDSENTAEDKNVKKTKSSFFKIIAKGVGFVFFLIGVAATILILRPVVFVNIIHPFENAYEETGDDWEHVINRDDNKILVFRDKSFSDGMLQTCEGKTNIAAIYILHCPRITDKCVDSLARIPNLRRIVIEKCDRLENPDFAKLAKLKNLKRLSVRFCVNLKDEAFAKIAQLRTLKILQASGCSQLTPKSVGLLANLPLVEFAPPECVLTDKTIEELTKFRRLRCLVIAAAKDEVLPLTDAGIPTLAKMKKLYGLNVFNCPNVSADSLNKLLNDVNSKRNHIYDKMLYIYSPDCQMNSFCVPLNGTTDFRVDYNW